MPNVASSDMLGISGSHISAREIRMDMTVRAQRQSNSFAGAFSPALAYEDQKHLSVEMDHVQNPRVW